MPKAPRSLEWIGLRLSVVSNRYTYPLYTIIEQNHALLRDEAAVLVSLSLWDGPTAQDIVRYTGRPKNSISRAVRKLEVDGSIERHDNTDDGRASCLYLTKKGKTQFVAIRGYYAERDNRMLASLSESDRQTLNRVLVSVLATSEAWM